jgi:hypothetical protein
MRLFRGFLCAALVSVALAGCATTPMPPTALIDRAPPVTLADKTSIDEQSVLAVTLAYEGAALTLDTLIRTRIIKGRDASAAAAIDAKAYRAVAALGTGYDAANAKTQLEALVLAREAVRELILLLKSKGA